MEEVADTRHGAVFADFIDRMLRHEGHLAPEMRRAAFEGRGVPEPLAGYVDKIHREAHRVTDADVARLLESGFTEDHIFEVTVAAALGAAMAQRRRALSAMTRRRER